MPKLPDNNSLLMLCLERARAVLRYLCGMSSAVSPEQVFSNILLEALTTSPVIKAAVAQRSADDIVLVLSSLAFNEWLKVNKLTHTKERYLNFLFELNPQRSTAHRAIAAQRSSPSYASLTQ